ncbi:MAG: DNA polymerase III subunit beta [Acidiferrobacterales bacterium]
MKFVASQGALLNAFLGMKDPAHAQQLPILGHSLVTVDDRGVLITATDLEMQVQTRIDAEISEPGQTTMPTTVTSGFCRSLPADARAIVKSKGRTIEIVCGDAKFALKGFDPKDFPVSEDIGKTTKLTMPAATLHSLLDYVQHAAAIKDNARPWLNGILLERKANTLVAVATNSNRLAMRKVEISKTDEPTRQIIVPNKGVKAILHLLSGLDGDINIDIGWNHLRVTTGNVVMTTKLLNGQFPNYESIIPALTKQERKDVTVKREEILRLIHRVSLLCDANAAVPTMRLFVSSGTLAASAFDQQRGEANDRIHVQYDGEQLEYGINARFLVDALTATPADDVLLSFKDSDTSVVLTPATVRDDGSDGTMLCIIGPCRL